VSARPIPGRRGLLLGAIGLGVPLLYRPLGPWRWRWRPRGSDAARLTGLLEHQRSARAVGREYLRVAPAEASAGALASLVVSQFPAEHRALGRVMDRQLRELLLLAVRQDFLQGRTVELHGWIVALTEARVCAIAALRSPPPAAPGAYGLG